MDDAYAGPERPSSELFDPLDRARSANTMGLIATILCLLAPCSSCTTLMFAFPLSIVAVHFGRTALAASDDEVVTAYGRTGLTLGTVALVYCSLVLLLIALYVLMYVGLFAAAISGNLQ